MGADALLDSLMSKLQNEFSAFHKDVQRYRYVVDLSSVDSKTRGQVTRKLSLKFPELKDYGTYTKNMTGNKRNRFLVLTSKKQVRAVEEVLNTSASSGPGPASQERVQQFVMQKSAKSRTALSANVNAKTKDLMKYASPEFKVEFEDRVGKQLASYNFIFSLPKDVNEKLKFQLVNTMKKEMVKEIKAAGKDTEYARSIQRRIEDLGSIFKTGKPLNSGKSFKKTVKSKKKTTTTKTYLAPLQTATGLFTNLLSIQNTLNILLHDTIQDSFMKPSSAASSRDYLRYQSGRFAKSASVETVGRRGDSLIIGFDYMTRPYDLYTTGSNNGPGRNPERIIEGAIRQIMIRQMHNKFNIIVGKL